MKPLEPDSWKQILHSGSALYLSSGASCPYALLKSLQEQWALFSDLRMLHGQLSELPQGMPDASLREHLQWNSLHLEPMSWASPDRLAETIPCPHHAVPRFFRDGVIPVDVALISVTPPDAQGFCSLGPSVDMTLAAVERATVVVAQVNDQLPRTFGSSFIHISQIHWFLEESRALPEWMPGHPSQEEELMGAYAAQLIEDGATLHLGVDSISEAVLYALEEHRDLGFFGPVLGDAARSLIDKGVINNSRLKDFTGKTVAVQVLGSRELYRWAHENPHLQLLPVDQVSAPLLLAGQNRLTAVCAGGYVDLSGQAVLAGGLNQYRFAPDSDALRGAAMCPTGKSIVVLPSVRQGVAGPESTIVPWFNAGVAVGGTHVDVEFVVTERGVATLQARSVRDRIIELVQIAHPAFQENLLRKARERNLLPQWFSVPPPYKLGEPVVASRRIRLKDEKHYILRPLTPADDHRLQEFFYSHSPDTIHSRYGFNLNRMGEKRAHELVSINQNKDLALGIFELCGARQQLHAVGRYYLDKTGKSAEIAFVTRESKRRLGMTRLLLEEMMDIAREREMEYLWAQVDRDNYGMLKLFQLYHPHGIPGDDDSTVKIAIALSEDGEIRRKHRYSILRPFRRHSE